jgi:hypothetical protein
MRFTLPIFILLFSIGFKMKSQNQVFYKLGQNFAISENVGLVIKNDPRTLKKLESLPKYAAIKTIKLVGFDSKFIEVDSLLFNISQSINPRLLIFETCDLNDLTESFDRFSALDEIRIVKNSSFYENSFFHAFRNSSVKRLYLEQDGRILRTFND